MAGLTYDKQGFPVVASEIGGLAQLGGADVNVVGNARISPGQHFFMRRAVAPVFAAIRAQLAEDASLVVHISSAMPGEGVSTVARELAFIAGQSPWCSTLLLDGNATGMGHSAYFGLPPLPEISRGVRQPDGALEVIQVQAGDSTFHLASLPMTGSEAAVVGEPGFLRQAYARLKEAFRLTIIDCPPVMTSPDTTALSGLADGIILVVQAEKTRIPVVIRTREEIENADGVVRGIVLNKRRHYIPAAIYRLL